MRILVTGGAGYIGTPLCAHLARRHEVVCWDPGFFGYHFTEPEPRIELVRRPVQRMTDADLVRLAPDWVLHLSGLSNDPMADFAPRMNWRENMEATRHVGELTDRRAIPLVFASSASVYGYNDAAELHEDAPVSPIGYYSKSKAAAEEWLRAHHHHAVIFRQATVMGVSPRMRFDLLTNGMTKSAWTHGVLRVLYGGRETRPQVHVGDLVSAYDRVLSASPEPGTYNVASSNDSVMELARAIRDQLAVRRGKAIQLEVTDEPRVHRSYSISSDKLRQSTGWQPRLDVAATVDELCDFLDGSGIDPEDPRWYNIRWMKLLFDAQEILRRTGPIDMTGEEAPHAE